MNTSPLAYDATQAPTTTKAVIAAGFAVQAKIAKVDAGKVYTQAEVDAIVAMTEARMETVTLPDGTKVTIKGGFEGEVTRAIDVDALAEKVPAATLAKVTRQVIDLSKFDAAVEIGLIDPATAAAVTTETERKPALVITMPKAAKR